MLTKATEERKGSAGEATAVFLPQDASALGSPSRKVGFEAFPGAGPFAKDRVKPVFRALKFLETLCLSLESLIHSVHSATRLGSVWKGYADPNQLTLLNAFLKQGVKGVTSMTMPGCPTTNWDEKR